MGDTGRDEQPLRGGIFRRLTPGRSGMAASFSLVEEIFAPSRHDGRAHIEEQRRLTKPAPSPTDPPDLPVPASPGQPRNRFAGRFVIRRP